MPPKLSVILPCAGDGERLGLENPKELYEIERGLPLIQYSLNHILAASEIDMQVLLVIKPGKEEVVDYVRKAIPKNIPVKPVPFDENYEEWPGSIYSAQPHYTAYNLVLLPDSYLTLSPKHSLILQTLRALYEHNLVFGIKRSGDPNTLKNLGALHVEQDSRVTRFQDKPTQADRFNAIWGCFGFRREIGTELYKFLIHSVKKQPTHYENLSFYPAHAFELENYFDLGTWQSIERFKKAILTD